MSDMPPLPPADHYFDQGRYTLGYGYSDEQMHDYARTYAEQQTKELDLAMSTFMYQKKKIEGLQDRLREAVKRLRDAQNNISDTINTFGGGGDEAMPEGLYRAMDMITVEIDAFLAKPAVTDQARQDRIIAAVHSFCMGREWVEPTDDGPMYCIPSAALQDFAAALEREVRKP